jgi:hypothetical protein
MNLGFSRQRKTMKSQSSGKTHIIIQSQCFYHVDIGIDNINCARSLVVKLLLSPHDTEDGIVLSADMPFGQSGLMNVSRPAVLRTYYGLNVQHISPTEVKRVTYGPTSTTGSLSMNPTTFSTKLMSTDMYQLGQCLKIFAKTQFERQNKCSDIFDCDFNHCTILTYNVHSPNVNCKLAYHTDCQYDHNGTFKTNKNTQGKNTAVIVYSLGDSRKLYFRRRMVMNSRKKWKNDRPCFKFTLDDNSIFVLHPMDEKPIIRNPTETLSHFQHGNVTVKLGNLSIALVFRNVTHTLDYNNMTSKRILGKEFTEKYCKQLEIFQATTNEYRQNQHHIGSISAKHAQKKFSSFGWT